MDCGDACQAASASFALVPGLLLVPSLAFLWHDGRNIRRLRAGQPAREFSYDINGCLLFIAIGAGSLAVPYAMLLVAALLRNFTAGLVLVALVLLVIMAAAIGLHKIARGLESASGSK